MVYKVMKTRILSAVVGISLAVGLLILGNFFPVIIDLSLAVITAMCVYEGLSAKALNKKVTIAVPCVAFSFLFCLIYANTPLCLILAYVFVVALFLSMIFNHEKLVFSDLAFALTITILCTMGMWSVVFLFDLTKSMVGLFFVVTALATPWLADGGAYFGGSFFGKRKLCPKISPKKTVEGAVSGVIIGTLLSLLVGVIFENFLFTDGETVNYLFLAIYGLFGAVISIVGDLSFSLIKRSCGVKDYGSLIPGHGGMLDRFDSVVFSAPLLVIFNMYFPIIENTIK